MKSYKFKPLLISTLLIFGMCEISGCTFLKEKFLSDITKNSCELHDWSSVGALALDNGNNPDSFNHYKMQCKKYFAIDVPDSRNESFLSGYNEYKTQYCTPANARNVGTNCGYYNIQQCKDIVPNDTIINLFDSFQEGNENCKNRMYQFGADSCTCSTLE